MERSLIYNGTITAEQFLFYEIRIASKYYLDGTSVEDAIEEIKKNNLFQYPTERLVARMVRSCYKRLDALDDEQLRQELSSAPPEIAKQINLYAMMRYNRIVWDFMVGVIGEKFRSQDFEFSRKDLNVFFSHLQEQNDDIAGWSETTVNKIKQVLTKILVEVEILDIFKSTRLNPLFLCEELELRLMLRRKLGKHCTNLSLPCLTQENRKLSQKNVMNLPKTVLKLTTL